MTLAIRPARPSDAALVFSLIGELADYENLRHELTATRQDIANALFALEPRLFCDIAECDGEPAGFAVWFLVFSTFSGQYGLYLEDVFVRPPFRRRGVGTALLKRLAQHCVDKGYARFEWAVLDWNAPAIGFYESLGARVMQEWRLCRMTGAALARFGREDTP